MRYKLLGKSGLRVSELCLGTMTFGETWGWGADYATCEAMFNTFVEAGGNFLDTSCNYTNGTSEEFLGKLIQSYRQELVVATKYTLTPTDNVHPNLSGNHRKNMVQSVERSLKRLQTDYLDLLYLHAWDYMTPVEEVMRGLDDLVAQGKVLYLVISDTPAYIVAEANTLASLRGWSRFVGLQLPYSLVRRDIERELLPMAKHHEMAVLPWGIIGAGLLTGKFLNKVTDPTRLNPEAITMTEKTEAIVRTVVEMAAEIGRSPSQVAINWVRQQQHRAQMIPILGARRVDQLQDNLACLEWQLDDAQMKKLNEISAIEYGFPHDFLNGSAKQFIFGKTFDRIDNHRGNNPLTAK